MLSIGIIKRFFPFRTKEGLMSKSIELRLHANKPTIILQFGEICLYFLLASAKVRHIFYSLILSTSL